MCDRWVVETVNFTAKQIARVQGNELDAGLCDFAKTDESALPKKLIYVRALNPKIRSPGRELKHKFNSLF